MMPLAKNQQPTWQLLKLVTGFAFKLRYALPAIGAVTAVTSEAYIKKPYHLRNQTLASLNLLEGEGHNVPT